jgi:hypothetical protein
MWPSGREEVPFPHDSPNWLLVQMLLTELQECLLNETISAEDTVLHMQASKEREKESERQ